MGIRPKLRPKDEEFDKIKAAANSGGGDDKPASGGKGGGKSVNPMAKKGSADYKTMQKANAPDSFYGYYDQNTGDYVPWYIDMINGGGANQAGPQFEGGFGAARLAGGLLNAAGVSPYGQDRARPFMPMEAFRGGDDVPLRQAPLAAAPTGGGAGGGVIDAVLPKPDQRNMDIVDAYNRSQADAGAQAALMSDIYDSTILPPGAGGLRNRNMSADPYAPVGGSNPAVQAEIARRQEAQRMMSYEPLGEGLFGTVEDVRFGPRAKRAEPTSLLDTRQQVPQPDEARALQAIADNNMMPDFINLPPYQQRAMITAMLERGY